MKLKKIAALALVACTVLSSNVVANASATDSSLPTSFISSTTGVYTTMRDKDNYSCHYIYNLTSLELMVISNGYSGANRTKNGGAVISAMSQRFINNYVREYYINGEEEKSQCRLYIRSNIGGSYTTLSGAWSPDSVGSYPIANP